MLLSRKRREKGRERGKGGESKSEREGHWALRSIVPATGEGYSSEGEKAEITREVRREQSRSMRQSP
jgi:hypothetical protein